MPHITVDYSDSLAEHFDRRGFGLALHPLVARTVEGSVAGCRTRFRQVDEHVIADGSDDVAMVHAEVSLLSGRTPEVKAELSRAVLSLVRDYVKPASGITVHFSVDIRDTARGCYTSHSHRENLA
ncbi:isomerase [Streptomyces sp. HNM0574]|uniref:5-carboxymethyl-2-hydroxymuconate Delta-isomerase n=1 Tax=Streptomyces sp. HNM0574 TaxID=2714954 RepID=UPI00146BAFD7|nr:isomerase [Streptomyces sp. HNM0574]NLU70204.1 isomerase [Streptomyces sp. HNM0574]